MFVVHTDGILQETELFVGHLIGSADGSHDNVGVAVEVLGARVHYQVSTQCQGTLEVRRQERVVNNNKDLCYRSTQRISVRILL